MWVYPNRYAHTPNTKGEIMKSMPERQFFKENLISILGNPVPDSAEVREGEIDWVWAENKSSFTVFIDGKGKIDLEVSNYPKPVPDFFENIKPAQVIQKARDFRSNNRA